MKKSTTFCLWDDDNYMGDEVVSTENQTTSDTSKEDTESPITGKPTLSMIPKQLRPNDLITCRDKLSNAIFCADSTVLWEDVISGKVPIKVVEKEWRTIYPPKGKPQTISKSIATVTVQLGIREAVDECVKRAIMTEKPGEFDRVVLEACLTHQYHGQFGIAISTIFKYMGGDGDPSPKMRQAIWNSIDKMRYIDVTIDATEAYQKLERLHNTDGTPKRKPIKVDATSNWLEDAESGTPRKKQNRFILKGYLLPAIDVDICCNGLTFEGIKFLDVSPVFTYAKDKGETDVISQRLIQAAKRRATKNFIALKSYILGRIRAIQRNQNIGSNSVQPILTFNALYTNCGDPEKAKTDSKFRTRIREAAVEYLKVLAKEGEISEFTCVDRNNRKRFNLAECVKIRVSFQSFEKKEKMLKITAVSRQKQRKNAAKQR